LFIALSGNKVVRGWAEQSRMGRRLASRFVAGMTVEEAVAACERVNREGIAVSLDSLGESVALESEARAAAEIYHKLLDAIAAGKLNANVSLKLTQMGTSCRTGRALARDGNDRERGTEDGNDGWELAEEIVGGVVEHAARVGSFVRIDMEGAEYTEATIAMTERLYVRFPASVGTVLQAYLYRTEADTERLLGEGIRIRLCKGAYKERPEVAFPAKGDVDANYVKLMKRMATSGVFCGIATHDEAIVEEMLRFVREQGVAKSAFEFQMLYGIRRDLQRRLAAEGFGVRVYIPFGTAWYPYFMRRLAERPANVVFLARNYFRN
jgi:proline dehydrogenase